MTEHLNLITGLTEHERKKLFSWLASLPEENIIEIFQDGEEIVPTQRGAARFVWPNHQILRLCHGGPQRWLGHDQG